MQHSRRLLLRAVGQRVNPSQQGSASFSVPCLTTAIPTTAAPVYATSPSTTPDFSSASASLSSPGAVGAAAGHVGSNSSSDGTCASVGADAAAIRPGANPVLQRYSELLATGGLQRDEQQFALVLQLAGLYDEICSYKARMDEHHAATKGHQARRLKRLRELLAEDAAAEEEERRRKEQQQGEERQRGASPSSVVSGWAAWLKSALAPLTGTTPAVGPDGGAAGADSELIRARAAAARREEVLARELGPPPAAPEPPKGIYVWGSVGSGKSMLVSLFYQALVETAQLPASRWMHFNAAMLEVHSRLHHLDTERWRQRREREAATAAAQLQQQQGQGQGQQGVAAQGVARGADGSGDEDDEEEVDAADAAFGGVAAKAGGGIKAADAAAAAADLPVPEHLQGVFRHWDPKQDPEVARQREAKAAMLAVRRHMRLARLGRNDPRTLAAANAQGLVRMAASFIRGRAGDPRSGWGAAGGAGSGPIASVLYFDEVQVTDVFSAVALKGLVEALTSAGCVLVCTSNRSPGDLPRHGLHEDMWGHFVETLLQRCVVHELSSPSDYRRVLLEQGRANIAAAMTAAAAGGAAASTRSGSGSSGSGEVAAAAAPLPVWPPLARSYILSAGHDGRAELERLWRARDRAAAAAAAVAEGGDGGREHEAPGSGERAMTVPVLFGRSLSVPRVSRCGGAAWFSFPQLCGQALGPADYVALSQRFHTVFLEGVPAMSMQVRDQARRFITLLDELYNNRCLLVASADVPPEQLFAGAGGRAGGGEGQGEEEREEPIIDLEGLQFETAVEGARLRRDVTAGGGVAPVASTPAALAAAAAALGGAEERFAFRRAVSRLLEMQSPQYITAAIRLRQQGQKML